MPLWTQTRKAPAGDIEELKSRFTQSFARFGAPPAQVQFEAAQLGPVAGEWARPERAQPGRVILYFHGGGFICGSPESHRPLSAKLAEIGEADAFSVRYRLAPDYVFPAPVRDGIDAYRALLASGIEPRQVVLAGDGSGGGLAFAVALAIRNAGLAMPAAIAAMSPWADLSLSGWSLLLNAKSDDALDWTLLFQCARHYLRKANPADAYASPVFANLKDFPPVMVHAGSAEILRDDASKLGDRAAESQVSMSVEIYDGMGHLFQCEGHTKEAKISFSRLGQFIRNKTRVD
jgi:epsilon-lactone hydrolase